MEFNVNYRNFVNQLVPHFLRRTNTAAWLYSLIKGLKDVNNNGYVVLNFGQKNVSL